MVLVTLVLHGKKWSCNSSDHENNNGNIINEDFKYESDDNSYLVLQLLMQKKL